MASTPVDPDSHSATSFPVFGPCVTSVAVMEHQIGLSVYKADSETELKLTAIDGSWTWNPMSAHDGFQMWILAFDSWSMITYLSVQN